MKSSMIFALISLLFSAAFAQAPGNNSADGLSQRDPFRLPQYLILKIKEKVLVTKVEVGGIDDSVDPIRRWPLSSYTLVGIIWDVKRPKAMFLDKQNSIHMLQIKERIGNGGGVVSVINNGEVVVIENKTPLRLKLTK